MAARRTTNKTITEAEIRKTAKELKESRRTRARKRRTGVPGAKQLTADLKRIEDRSRAWDMKIKHMTFHQIARILGCSHVHVMNLVYEAGAEIVLTDRKKIPILRAIENERLDEASRSMVPLMHGQISGQTRVVGTGKTAKTMLVPPDPVEIAKVQGMAAQRIVNISNRRASLNGLDAPIKIAPTDPAGEQRYHDLSEDELERIIHEKQIALGLPAGS